MTDLDAAIRARLGIEPQGLFAKTIIKGTVTHVIGLADWAREADAALLAVLNLHADWEGHLCVAEFEGYSVQRWHGANDPCPTVRVIAEKLGVEVPGV